MKPFTWIVLLIVLALGACGKKSEEPLSKGRARTIVASYLEDPRYDVAIDTGEGTPVRADLLGKSGGHYVAVVLDAERQRGYRPARDYDAEYILELPLRDEKRLREAMEGLKKLRFPTRKRSVPSSRSAPVKKAEAKKPDKAPLRYVGGLKDQSCLPGMKLRFEARFEPEEANLSVRYLVEDLPLEGSEFRCDTPATYTLQAVAGTPDGREARSPKYRIRIDPLPEELNFEPGQHVHF